MQLAHCVHLLRGFVADEQVQPLVFSAAADADRDIVKPEVGHLVDLVPGLGQDVALKIVEVAVLFGQRLFLVLFALFRRGRELLLQLLNVKHFVLEAADVLRLVRETVQYLFCDRLKHQAVRVAVIGVSVVVGEQNFVKPHGVGAVHRQQIFHVVGGIVAFQLGKIGEDLRIEAHADLLVPVIHGGAALQPGQDLVLVAVAGRVQAPEGAVLQTFDGVLQVFQIGVVVHVDPGQPPEVGKAQRINAVRIRGLLGVDLCHHRQQYLLLQLWQGIFCLLDQVITLGDDRFRRRVVLGYIACRAGAAVLLWRRVFLRREVRVIVFAFNDSVIFPLFRHRPTPPQIQYIKHTRNCGKCQRLLAIKNKCAICIFFSYNYYLLFYKFISLYIISRLRVFFC